MDSVSPRPALVAKIWPLVGAALVQALLLVVSLQLIAAVQAYMRLESLWCKGVKDAVVLLHRYTDTGSEADYRLYQAAIARPLAYLDARHAMEAGDAETARINLVEGGSAAVDTSAMIWLFRNFEHVDYLMRARAAWGSTDEDLFALAALGERTHTAITAARPASEQLDAWREELYVLNASLTQKARTTSAILSDGSRATIYSLVGFNLVIGAGLILLGVVITRRLLGASRSAEAALERERTMAEVTLASIGDAVLRIDEMGRITYLNAAAEALLGQHSGEIRLLPLQTVFHLSDDHNENQATALAPRILAGEIDARASGELVRSDGEQIPVSIVATPIRDKSTVLGAVLVFRDMTREYQQVANLAWQANHDALTGLVNRREFERRLQRALERLTEQGGRHALLFIDLDQFKIVNDSCGHAAGDQLLRLTTSQLQQSLRDRDTLARLGGDEFGVLLENCAQEPAMQVAEKLRQCVSDIRFSSNGREFRIGASIGVACFGPDEFGHEEALRAADMACYLAKEKGRNRVQLYDPEAAEFSQRFGDMVWMQRIHRALENDGFALLCQDVAAIGPNADEGWHFEILLRLIDDGGHQIPPGAFFPAAERYGLMTQIDRWVVRKAIAILSERQRSSGLRPIATCGINLSGATISDPAFIDFLSAELEARGVAPRLLCLELKETAALANLENTARFIDALHALGCRFSLDNFGAGMTSFAYLKRLPVDYVKIDGDFIKDVSKDPVNDAMVETINSLARMMGKQTIAEFVETAEALAALKKIEFDFAQGYAIARPRPFTATD